MSEKHKKCKAGEQACPKNCTAAGSVLVSDGGAINQAEISEKAYLYFL